MPVGNKSFNLNNVQVADIKAKTQFIVKTEEGRNGGSLLYIACHTFRMF